MATLGKALQYDEAKLNAFMKKPWHIWEPPCTPRSSWSATSWDSTKPWPARGWLTSAELAARTNTADAASGYVNYDPAT